MLPTVGREALLAIQKGVEDNHPITNLDTLGINQRLINLLESEGIHDLGDLMACKQQDLLAFKNFGEKGLETVLKALSRYHKLKI